MANEAEAMRVSVFGNCFRVHVRFLLSAQTSGRKSSTVPCQTRHDGRNPISVEASWVVLWDSGLITKMKSSYTATDRLRDTLISLYIGDEISFSNDKPVFIEENQTKLHNMRGKVLDVISFIKIIVTNTAACLKCIIYIQRSKTWRVNETMQY